MQTSGNEYYQHNEHTGVDTLTIQTSKHPSPLNSIWWHAYTSLRR